MSKRTTEYTRVSAFAGLKEMNLPEPEDEILVEDDGTPEEAAREGIDKVENEIIATLRWMAAQWPDDFEENKADFFKDLEQLISKATLRGLSAKILITHNEKGGAY